MQHEVVEGALIYRGGGTVNTVQYLFTYSVSCYSTVLLYFRGDRKNLPTNTEKDVEQTDGQSDSQSDSQTQRECVQGTLTR
jgi:hypothetical protein